MAALSTQTGGDVSVYDSITNFVATPWLEDVLVKHDSGVDTAVIVDHTPIGETGEEIEYVYLITGSGIAGSRKFKQGATASDAAEVAAAQSDNEIVFEYDTTTKTITLPEGLFADSMSILVQYKYAGVGLETTSDMEHFSKTVKAVLDVTLQDLCDKELSSILKAA